LIAYCAANQVDVHKGAYNSQKLWRRLGQKPLLHKQLPVMLMRRFFAVYAGEYLGAFEKMHVHSAACITWPDYFM